MSYASDTLAAYKAKSKPTVPVSPTTQQSTPQVSFASDFAAWKASQPTNPPAGPSMPTGMPADINSGLMNQVNNPGFVQSLKNDFAQRGQTVTDAVNRNSTMSFQSGFNTAGAVVGQGAGLVSDVLVEGLNSLTGGLLKKGMQKVGEIPAVNKTLQAIDSWSKQHPDAANNLAAVINTLAIAPELKGAQLAGKTAAEGVARGTQALGEVTKVAGQTEKAVAQTVVEKAIPMAEQEAKRLQAYRAAVPLPQRIVADITGTPATIAGKVIEKPVIAAQTAFKKGFAGTESMIGVQAKRSATDLWKNTIEPAVASIKKTVTTNELFSSLESKIAQVTKDPSLQVSIKEGLDSVKADWSKQFGKSQLTYKTLQEIKSNLDQFIPAKMFKGVDVAGAANNVRKLIADEIRQRTYDTLKEVNIKRAYLDYGNLTHLMELGVKNMAGSKLKGGFGGFVSNLVEQAAVPVATIGGQVLYKAGDLTFLAGKGIKKVGDYLKKFGF